MDVRRFFERGTRAWAVLAMLACSLLASPAASAKAPVPSPRAGYAQIRPVCPPPLPGSATCFALARVPVASTEVGRPGVRRYTVGAGAVTVGPAGGLTPALLASAYGYTGATGGSSQTVAIVDAYDDPKIEEDLAIFDTQYKLAACTTANGCFKKVSQSGSPSVLPEADTTGWSVEISLDVEAVHAACQACKVLLVEANSSKFTDLAAAVNEAVSLGATEVSNSYGGPEAESVASAAYKHPGVVIAAATGDHGYDGWTYVNESIFPPERPNIPSTLPSVVSVGGTTLKLTEAGSRAAETVWDGNGPVDSSEFNEGASGGGCSTLFTAQPWQLSVPGWGATGCGSKRLAADVAAVADPLTGFDIHDSYNCGTSCEAFTGGKTWLTIGGTSLATPLISALYALAGGGSGVNYPALTLYGHLGDPSSVYDVTAGGNGYCGGAPKSACGNPNAPGFFEKGLTLHVDCEYTTACNAAVGFDGPSGVGTPSSLALFKPALPTAAIAAPAKLRPGVSAGFSGAASSDPYPGGSISEYSWGWGDGTPEGSGVAPTHSYSASGEYSVTLTVTDSYGLKSVVATQPVKVATIKEIEEEEAAKKKAEEEVAKKAGEEARKRAEAEAVARSEAEASARRRAEEEAAARLVQVARGGVAGQQTTFAVPDAELVSTSLLVSPSGVVTVKLSCPAAESSCAGTVTLRTLSAVLAASGSAARQRAAVLTLATGSFNVAGGKVVSVVLHLSAKARTLLARSHLLHARATILAHDAVGTTHSAVATVTLRLVKARHGKH